MCIYAKQSYTSIMPYNSVIILKGPAEIMLF